MKILVIQNRMGIGDMIMFLPFIKAISNYYGEQVSLMVKKSTKASEYLNEEKYIKEIIYLERSEGEKRHAGVKGFFNLIEDFKETHKVEYMYFLGRHISWNESKRT